MNETLTLCWRLTCKLSIAQWPTHRGKSWAEVCLSFVVWHHATMLEYTTESTMHVRGCQITLRQCEAQTYALARKTRYSHSPQLL